MIFFVVIKILKIYAFFVNSQLNLKFRRNKVKKSANIFLHNRHYEKVFAGGKTADGTVKDIEDEIPFDVPEGWAWVRGSEILSQMTSRKPTGDFFNYIDIDAIDNKKHKIIYIKTLRIFSHH